MSLSQRRNKILRCLIKAGESCKVVVRSWTAEGCQSSVPNRPLWTTGVKELRKATDVPSQCLVSAPFFLDCGHEMEGHSQERTAYSRSLHEMVHLFLEGPTSDFKE